jgi:hypothetical protein
MEEIKKPLLEFLTKFENGIYEKLDDKTKGIIKPSLDKVKIELNKKGIDINLIKPVLKEFRAGFGNPDIENAVPSEVKDLYLKYKIFLNSLNFDNLIGLDNITKISSFLLDKSNFNFPPPSGNLPVVPTVAQTVATPITQSVVTPSIENLGSVGNMLGKSGIGAPPGALPTMPQELPQGMSQGLPQGLPGMPQGLPGMPQGLPGMPQGMPGMPQGMPGMSQGMPGMPQGAFGALGAVGERLIIKKIEETFLKIQQQICATFNEYKKQIGEALIKKMVEKIEEHSTAFKEYTKFRYDYEANKSAGKSALNTSNVFFQIYDNVRAQIQYKQLDFKKVDFSDQIFSKYEAWKTEYDKKKNNSLLSGGGDTGGDEKDLYNTMKAAYDAISLPEDAAKKMTTGLFKKIFGVEMTEEQIEKLKEQNAENEKNGLDENGKPNGIKKPEKKKENVLDEAVKKSIDNLKIPFTIAQMDLIYEKVFFGLHNPSVLIVKLLCNIDDEEREQLIKDLTIQDTRNKMKAYHNEYMANKKGWPERTKTIWEKIACNMNRHTDCPENFKAPPLLEPLTGAGTDDAIPGSVPVTGAAVPSAVTGGYEKYIRKARKTKRKRLVKKGKRKNKSYHRRVSV